MMKSVLSFFVAVLAFVTSTELIAQERRLLRRPSAFERLSRNRQSAGGARTAAERNQRAAAPTAGARPSAPANTRETGETASAAPEKPTDPREAPALNWDAAPLDIVLQAYSEQTGKTILKDPGAPSATITLKTLEGQKLTKAEYLEAIEVVLEMNGIHLEAYGEKFIRALPRKDVRKEGIPLIMDPTVKLGETGRVVSMMIPFKNISTEEAQKALEGFKSNSGILLVFERTNSILVTDTEQNINRMLEIARTIDIATPVLENVFVRQIKNASAAEIKTALEAIVQESQKELEKAGKAANSTLSSQTALQHRPSLLGGRLLGRRTQPETPQPVNNASLVMSVSDADRGMIRGKVLILSDERSNKLIIVTQKTNMDFFDKVIEQLDIETTPDTIVKVYRLKYAEAEEVSDMINDLIGNAASSKGGKENQNRNAKSGAGANLSSRTQTAARKPANQRTGEAKAGELTKDNTTVLADKRINGLVVMTQKELVPVVEKIIESMDVKLDQVLIETVIVEVSLGDGLDTGIDWIKRGRGMQKVQQTDPYGRKLYWEEGEDGKMQMTTEETDLPVMVNELVRDGLWSNGTKGFVLGGGGMGAKPAAEAIAWGSTNLLGKGINYILKSDKLDLAAVVQATKTDSRSKYLASPIVMTVDNKEATVEATEMRYLFKGYQYSGSTYNGTAVPDYGQKQIGITIKMTPKINPNGRILLSVETEYSQEGAGQKITGTTGQDMTAATTVTRKMSADILLDNMQTAIMGGLTQTHAKESESGIPILKDIPWVGKWLFGSVSQNEARSELLIFMMPYVLDDGDATQAEAIRRKKSLSDSRPWEDHGWSLSELADPVSKKEQLRRLKEEWERQDEERKTKLAIEQEKIKRAKQLERMSDAERTFWLELHKEELEDEQREELEKKMLDKRSQEELRALVEKIKREKLAAAQKEIRAADEMDRAENERGKLEAAKSEKAKEPAK